MSLLRFQEAAQETETVFIFYYFQYRFSNWKQLKKRCS